MKISFRRNGAQSLVGRGNGGVEERETYSRVDCLSKFEQMFFLSQTMHEMLQLTIRFIHSLKEQNNQLATTTTTTGGSNNCKFFLSFEKIENDDFHRSCVPGLWFHSNSDGRKAFAYLFAQRLPENIAFFWA